MIKIRRFKLKKPVPFLKLIPSVLTLLGLVLGISSIRFAVETKWEIALYCILVATIIDGVDGRIARLLNATSTFGAELDSLCDFANFGIATGCVIYLWICQQEQYKLLSWTAISLFIVCMAVRLARFNTTIQHKNFFTGVPAPCGAILALMPIMLDFDIATMFNISGRINPILVDIYVVIVGILMASKLPTFSAKNIHISPEYISLFMIVFGMIIISVIVYTWYILPVLCILYLLSIPLSYYINMRESENNTL